MRYVRYSFACTAISLSLISAAATSAFAGVPLPTTSADFKMPGTQPLGSDSPMSCQITDFMPTATDNCKFCHLGMDDAATTVKPFRWRGSMHSHSMRDPIFRAAMSVAISDAPGSGEFCIRCHSPRAWLEGRASPPTASPDGNDLFFSDIHEGVTCNVCHRLVDNIYEAGVSPPDDQLIINALDQFGFKPKDFGNATMIIDPMDVRRGPFADPAAPHDFAFSPHHRSGDLCGTCHDVSSPTLRRIGSAIPAPADTYEADPFMVQHATHETTDMFPEQRTYSEWQNSTFAAGGVDMGGRFGGNRTVMSACQDCHMPAVTGTGCLEIFEPPIRNDLPYHSFAAANVAALDMILHLHGPTGTMELDEDDITFLNRGKADSTDMLQRATDAALTQFAGELNTRITNQCGHKLLTGMPEGRRIWVNVKFFNGATLLAERGAYNTASGALSEADTKVYECKLGIDSYMAGLTGQPVGPNFHLMYANKIFKDNRIPPRGFTNAAFNAVQAGHFAYAYPDSQFWDDTKFCIPAGATRAEVRLYYQTASREYADFLLANGGANGATFHSAYLATGKSAPVLMDDVMLNLAPFALGDVTGDGVTSFADITRVLSTYGAANNPGISGGDANCDGVVNFADIIFVLNNYGDTA